MILTQQDNHRTFAIVYNLVFTYKAPLLSYIVETENYRYIQAGYGMLLPWDHIPHVGRGLARLRRLMQKAEIPVYGL